MRHYGFDMDNTVDALLELAIMIAVFAYVIGLVVPPLREELRRWAYVLIGFVFGAAVLIVSMRTHPIAFVVALAGMSVVAYTVLEIRRGHHESGHGRPASTPFLNLRVTGKTAVEHHDVAGHHEDEDNEEDE